MLARFEPRFLLLKSSAFTHDLPPRKRMDFNVTDRSRYTESDDFEASTHFLELITKESFK